MRQASPAPPSKASPKTSPTAWSRPYSGSAIGGLSCGVAYKAINTADSMIGHKNETYKEFGYASARLDDLVNLPASRLSALLISRVRGGDRPRRRAGAPGRP